MRRVTAVQKMLLFVCICIIVVSGCRARTQKGLRDLSGAASFQTVIQIPRVHTECSSMLDEGLWLVDDDAVSCVSLYDKKITIARRDGRHLYAIDVMAAGLAALFACVDARIYHGSSCPTRGLSCILAFIMKADGQKDNLSRNCSAL